MIGCGQQEFRGIGHAADWHGARSGTVASIFFAAVNQRHNRDAGLKPTQAERELWEDQQGSGDQQRKIALGGERRVPICEQCRMRHDFPCAATEDDKVERKIRQCRGRRQTDCFAEPLKKHDGEHREESERNQDLVIAEDRM